jgi:hypothetical protein
MLVPGYLSLEQYEQWLPWGWKVQVSKTTHPGQPYWVRIRDHHRQWEMPLGSALKLRLWLYNLWGGTPGWRMHMSRSLAPGRLCWVCIK